MQGALSDSIFPAMQENLSPLHMDLLGTWFASEKRDGYRILTPNSTRKNRWPTDFTDSSGTNASISPREKKGPDLRRSSRSDYVLGS